MSKPKLIFAFFCTFWLIVPSSAQTPVEDWFARQRMLDIENQQRDMERRLQEQETRRMIDQQQRAYDEYNRRIEQQNERRRLGY